ncbi:MAG: hypothetical protein AAGE99_04295 [Chlamydiota bacterium]
MKRSFRGRKEFETADLGSLSEKNAVCRRTPFETVGISMLPPNMQRFVMIE